MVQTCRFTASARHRSARRAGSRPRLPPAPWVRTTTPAGVPAGACATTSFSVHVAPPSVVSSSIEYAPTAKPCFASRNSTSSSGAPMRGSSGSLSGMRSERRWRVQVRPPSPECSTMPSWPTAHASSPTAVTAVSVARVGTSSTWRQSWRDSETRMWPRSPTAMPRLAASVTSRISDFVASGSFSAGSSAGSSAATPAGGASSACPMNAAPRMARQASAVAAPGGGVLFCIVMRAPRLAAPRRDRCKNEPPRERSSRRGGRCYVFCDEPAISGRRACAAPAARSPRGSSGTRSRTASPRCPAGPRCSGRTSGRGASRSSPRTWALRSS